MQTSVVGRNLRTTREARGWSRATLAGKANVSEPTIARVELYGKEPKLSTLAALARALGVDLDDLMRKPAGNGGPTRSPAAPAGRQGK